MPKIFRIVPAHENSYTDSSLPFSVSRARKKNYPDIFVRLVSGMKNPAASSGVLDPPRMKHGTGLQDREPACRDQNPEKYIEKIFSLYRKDD
jgi:hypothetical protein